MKNFKTDIRSKAIGLHGKALYLLATKGKLILPMLLSIAVLSISAFAQSNPFGNGSQTTSSFAARVVSFLIWGLPFAGFATGVLAIWKFRKKDENWTRELIFTVFAFGGWAVVMGLAWDAGNNSTDLQLDSFGVSH